MQSDKKNFDRGAIQDSARDFSKILSSATGVAFGASKEAEGWMKTQCEQFFTKMNLVSREEFEVVKQMAAKAREENTELKKRLAELEKKSGGKKSAAPAKKPKRK